METTRILSFAGPPASGKTTLCELLEQSYKQFERFHAPPMSNSEVEPGAFNDFLRQQQERASMLSESLLRAKLQSVQDVIICDRGIEDVICFTEYMAKTFFAKESEGSISLKSGLQSDYCIFLDVKSSSLAHREQTRRKVNQGRGLMNASDYWNFYRDWFLRRAGTIPISIDNEAPEQTAERILGELAKQ